MKSPKLKLAVRTISNGISTCTIDGKDASITEFIRFYKKGILEGWIKLVQDTETTLVYQYN